MKKKKEKLKRTVYRFPGTPEERKIHNLVVKARHRTLSSGLEFDLNTDASLPVEPAYQKHCSYCGEEMRYLGTGRVENKWDGVSLDRIDPTRGYTRDNTCLCCYSCNTKKSNETPESFEKFAARIREVAERVRNAKRE